MRLTRKIAVQLVIVAVIATVAAGFMFFGYVRVPSMFGIGEFTVTLELPRSGGLYERANVTYRGTQVGKVKSIQLNDNNTVLAVLSLNSGTHIPSNLRAEVHSQSAVGEQFVALLPEDDTSPPLQDGDVIPLA